MNKETCQEKSSHFLLCTRAKKIINLPYFVLYYNIDCSFKMNSAKEKANVTEFSFLWKNNSHYEDKVFWDVKVNFLKFKYQPDDVLACKDKCLLFYA